MIFLKSRRIFLKPLSENDNLDRYSSWINDQETTQYLGAGKFPLTVPDLQAFIRKSNSDPNTIFLGIFNNKTSGHIGNITLEKVDHINRHAEIGLLIGDRKFNGKGYATEAIKLIVDHAFNRLNLHKLYAGMISDNKASKRAFEKAGFKVEGIFKEHFYLNGRYLDCYRMGLLRKDFLIVSGAQRE